MNTSIETDLCELICSTADAEKEIEIYRKRMADAPGFEPYAAFIRISRRRSHVLSPNDINTFLL